MKVHMLARADHLASHIDAIWLHLPESLRGQRLVDIHARAPKYWAHDDIVMVASYLDTGCTGERRTIYVEHGAGQQYCLAPDTKVLTTDLRWVPIWQVAVGDQLVAFDEFPHEQTYREWRVADVLDAQAVQKHCFELTFSDGSVVTASEDHLWLRRERETYGWVSTMDLQDAETYPHHSTKLIKAFDVWDEDRSWGGGYLAAAFDGEGCLTQTTKSPRRPGCGEQQRNVLAFSQRDNEMLKVVFGLLDDRGFDYSNPPARSGANRDVHQIAIRGGYREVVRLLGSTRPRRLLGSHVPMNSGQFRGRPVELVSKRHVGKITTIALTTSTSTFIAEGFASHNCGNRMAAEYYHGGEHPQHVIGYIGPRPSVIEAWQRPGFATGSPVCDPYELFTTDKVAAITFHYVPTAARQVPEMGSAFEHYASRMGDVVRALRDHGYEVLGHRHPRFNHLRNYWQRHHGIPEASVHEVRSRAQLLIADNTSLIYEMLYLGRDVIALNAPWFRRNVEHGLRFWSHAPSVQAENPDELIELVGSINTIQNRSSDLCDLNICDYVYGKSLSDGHDGLRAASWVTAFVHSL